VCPSCGHVHNIFKTGGGEATAAEWKAPFLGRIPLDAGIVEAGDRGRSLMDVAGPVRESLENVVDNIIANLGGKEQGDESMKIAVPLAGGKLCQHFGHCQEFALVSVSGGKITAVAKKTPPPHEPGVLPAWLAKEGVDTVLAGGMGERAQAIFREKGIKVVCGVAGGKPEEVVTAYLQGTLVTGANLCDH